jgi:hypothetical protein
MADWRRIAPATLGVVLGAACLPGPRDLVVERCTEVIGYRSPGLRDISIEEIERGPGANEVTLQYEARDDAQDATLASRIRCRFDPANRWSLVSVRLDGRDLTEAEVALVNSEFLLRDLSESPERLGGDGSGR